MPFRSLSMIEHLRDLRPGKTAEKESRFFLDVRKNKRKWRVHLLIRGGATFFVSLNVALETSGAGACRAFPFPTRLALPCHCHRCRQSRSLPRAVTRLLLQFERRPRISKRVHFFNSLAPTSLHSHHPIGTENNIAVVLRSLHFIYEM